MFYNQCAYGSSDSKGEENNVTLPLLIEIKLEDQNSGLPSVLLFVGGLIQSWGGRKQSYRVHCCPKDIELSVSQTHFSNGLK